MQPRGRMTVPNISERPRSKRGFAAMDSGKQREIASKGGRAAHEQGRAHEFSPDEARAAGRKGGETVSRDRVHMAEIGSVGGRARRHNLALRANREQRPAVTMTSSAQDGTTTE